MNKFMYFQSTEGGMDAYEIDTAEDFGVGNLYGWMKEQNGADDTAMTVWMTTAEIGEFYEHRLGYLVRIKGSEE